jgi:YVTN family beta-propeller protein
VTPRSTAGRSTAAVAFGIVASLAGACARGRPGPGTGPGQGGTLTSERLPTGARLDPAGRSYDVGSFPLAAVLSPDGARLVLLLNGWREQGIQVMDRATRQVVQTVAQPAAFLGLAFSPDGRTLYASGGNEDVVYRYAWGDGRATLADSLVLRDGSAAPTGRRYPAGLAPSSDGRMLYVAENLGDSLAVVDLATGRVIQRLATERYPYGVAVAPMGTVYVSGWGGSTVSVFTPAPGGRLVDAARIRVSRHPSALLLSRGGAYLYVASASTDRVDVVDTRTRAVVTTVTDPPGSPTPEGSTPDALALSADGSRLFVAEADNNAIAVVRLRASGLPVVTVPVGRIPVGWYPSAVVALPGDTLMAVNAKGHGSRPNAETGPRPGVRGDPSGYTLGQISGTVTVVPPTVGAELGTLTDHVAHLDNWDSPAGPTNARAAYPPFEHVVYIIKENRTYDQVLGDLRQGDGDTAIVFFPRPVAPNHHALAERFGIWDRFFVNAEVSADGHTWSTAAYATDYVEKTVPAQYSARGRTYDYEGENRDAPPPDGDDVAAPSGGYLWDEAVRQGITLRDYGEFIGRAGGKGGEAGQEVARQGAKPALVGRTNPDYPGFDLLVPDQRRADVWIAELQRFAQQGAMPTLEVLRLPNDHTAGARARAPTPRAYMADNDLALGRMIEALSKTPFWHTSVVFVLEDDAQNGADHVDSHRAPLLIISPYSRGGVSHRFANTTDVLATIEEILGLRPMSPFDYFGRPLRDAFGPKPDFRPYSALTPGVDLNERNPDNGVGARESRHLDLSDADRADESLFNHVLWRAIKGTAVPEPSPRRASTGEIQGLGTR